MDLVVQGEPAGMTALAGIYGFAENAAAFAIQHIETLKAADNLLANRCGQVLEAANAGFGIGAETALVLIGVGQGLLGNPLTAGAAVPAGANPVVITCAAIGAIHYGWQAMSESEKEALLGTVGAAFQVGAEFIRSVTSFAFGLIQSLMSQENYQELKKLVATAAAAFGRHLSDVTGALSDRVAEGARYISEAASGAASTLWTYVPALPGRAASSADNP